MRAVNLLFVVCALALLSACSHADGSAAAHQLELAALEQAYVDSWINGDDEGVMSVFAPDAVITPSGSSPIEGRESMRRFWFPDDGSVTRIDHYETTIDGIRVKDDVAWYWGRGDLSFTWTGSDGERLEVANQKSVFTAIAVKNDRGEWLLHHRAWSNVQ